MSEKPPLIEAPELAKCEICGTPAVDGDVICVVAACRYCATGRTRSWIPQWFTGMLAAFALVALVALFVGLSAWVVRWGFGFLGS